MSVASAAPPLPRWASFDLAPDPTPEFCSGGIPWPQDVTIPPDAQVDLTILEAPLFSDSMGPIPGDLLNAYHVAIFFEVHSPGAPQSHNYTLEFDSVENAIMANIPEITTVNGSRRLRWSNQARYCLRHGLLLGREHWRHQYEYATTISGADFVQIGSNFMSAANTTDGYALGEYILPQVVSRQKEVLFHDTTCGTGALGVFAFLSSVCNVSFPAHLSISTSHFSIHADSIAQVNQSDSAAMEDVFAFYGKMIDAAHDGNHSKVTRGIEFFSTLKDFRYVYRAGEYYAVQGVHFPYVTVEYRESPFGIYIEGFPMNSEAEKWGQALQPGRIPM